MFSGAAMTSSAGVPVVGSVTDGIVELDMWPGDRVATGTMVGRMKVTAGAVGRFLGLLEGDGVAGSAGVATGVGSGAARLATTVILSILSSMAAGFASTLTFYFSVS